MFLWLLIYLSRCDKPLSEWQVLTFTSRDSGLTLRTYSRGRELINRMGLDELTPIIHYFTLYFVEIR